MVDVSKKAFVLKIKKIGYFCKLILRKKVRQELTCLTV
jgi:hypothetical protein